MRLKILLFILLSWTSNLLAQEFTSPVKRLFVESQILGENRELLLYSPDSSKRLPTLFLLDAGQNMSLTRGIVSNLVRANVMPQVHIVGVNNYDYDRVKDLSPPTASKDEEFGGADKFLEFLETEVFKTVQSEINLSDFKVLIGHSLGGLFATYTLLKKSEIFDAYIQIGGSYWFDEESVPKKVLSMKLNRIANKRLFFSLANEKDSRKGFDLLQSGLSRQLPMTKFDLQDNSDHITGLTPGIFRGLQFAFDDWKGWDELYESNDFEGIKAKVQRMSAVYNMTVKPIVPPLASFARSKTRAEEYERAIEILAYLEQFHPEHIMVLNYLGEAYQKKGDHKMARKIYERSLKVAERKGSPMKRWILKRISELDN